MTRPMAGDAPAAALRPEPGVEPAVVQPATSRREPRSLGHEVWEREMRRARTIARALAATLVALLARGLIAGWTITLALAAIAVGALLLAAVWLRHHGRTLEPDDRPRRTNASSHNSRPRKRTSRR